ncbi:post-PEP-CTERM-1 domain-containing protein [uncultured Paludibaculum sp.]|uniref:post-PEP-CTERM-1 domain-containing protein n=1 Tax=uncultured Paludibaculum sp. TaxID=1765020 RepID=UPI002AAA968C|nr:hypothetical protein [uncultured Paludibaculum sp.]
MSKVVSRVVFAATAVVFAATALCAASDDQKPATAQASATTDAKKQSPPGGSGGAMIFIDPATGKTRTPEPGEIEALTGSKLKSLAATAPTAADRFKSPTGAGIGLRLSDESMSYAVVTILPNGKLKQSCVTGATAASAVAAGGQTQAAKGALDEK